MSKIITQKVVFWCFMSLGIIAQYSYFGGSIDAKVLQLWLLGTIIVTNIVVLTYSKPKVGRGVSVALYVGALVSMVWIVGVPVMFSGTSRIDPRVGLLMIAVVLSFITLTFGVLKRSKT